VRNKPRGGPNAEGVTQCGFGAKLRGERGRSTDDENSRASGRDHFSRVGGRGYRRRRHRNPAGGFQTSRGGAFGQPRSSAKRSGEEVEGGVWLEKNGTKAVRARARGQLRRSGPVTRPPRSFTSGMGIGATTTVFRDMGPNAMREPAVSRAAADALVLDRGQRDSKRTVRRVDKRIAGRALATLGRGARSLNRAFVAAGALANRLRF